MCVKKKITIGLLAHVDAGKTTLSEALLYQAGLRKNLGRVDHQDAFLDFETMERQRGITIFSKQALIEDDHCRITILDTPGHVDFATEMERTLSVLDCAILIISGSDGIQTHTQTIWQLLERYHVPTMIFINKMDIPTTSHDALQEELEKRLSLSCVDFSVDEDTRNEAIAFTSDALLEKYETTGISDEDLRQAIASRHLFPCFYGSALKNVGIDHLIEAIRHFVTLRDPKEDFHAKVFKITHDANNTRLVHMKVTGGKFKVKDVLLENQKVDEIRLYNGQTYTQLKEASIGDVVAIKGLDEVYAGDILGEGEVVVRPVLSGCYEYRVILPRHIDVHQALPNFLTLFQEDPSLEVHLAENQRDIMMRLMGTIQIEVLKALVLDRFGYEIDFDHGRILYKETIATPVLGVGHYEPLRHYAEVHLLLEPLPNGSGLVFDTKLSTDILAQHWQNLILTHLKEKKHRGVLTGSEITDMKITLVNGRNHLKHTEGGDFRQATYRAVRHGLKVGTSVLLEPYFHFDVTLPTTFISTFIYQIEEMGGEVNVTSQDEFVSVASGQAPVQSLQDYQETFVAMTKGKGKIFYQPGPYLPARNPEAIIETIGYDSESDLRNPTGSVFCSHGAGYTVSYQEVYSKMHLEASWQKKEETTTVRQVTRRPTSSYTDEDLKAIFERTYGKISYHQENKLGREKKKEVTSSSSVNRPKCILVDGYNLMHAWPEIEALMNDNLDVARHRLLELLANYQGYKQVLMIVVFDAYMVKNNPGTIEQESNLYVVYTKEAQTADMFIERTTHTLASSYDISVVTSDMVEQIITSAKGATRISSREFREEVLHTSKRRLDEYLSKQEVGHDYPFEALRDLYKGEK